MGLSFQTIQITRSPRRKAAASGVVGWSRKSSARPCSHEKIGGTVLLAQCAADQKNHVAREPAYLAEIVRGHHDLDTGLRRHQNDLLNAAGRRGIEIGGRLVEQQDLRIARQRAGQRQPLLFAAREPPCRTLRQIGEPDAIQQCGNTRHALAARSAGLRQRIADIGRNSPSQHDRPLKQNRAAHRLAVSPAAPANSSGRRRRKPHAEPQQAGLARAVRPHDQRRRARRNRQAQTIEDHGCARLQRDVFENQGKIA